MVQALYATTPTERTAVPYSDPPVFMAWPKIARLNRDIVVTEKLDGTNACVIVHDDGQVYAQSRTRLITPGKNTDNYGFAAWVQEHADELRAGLGPGHHFGEWYGRGIQRTYGLDHRRFALFNTGRWLVNPESGDAESLPGCCEAVPVLYSGPFGLYGHRQLEWHLDYLRRQGSVAVPGFMRPEGVVVWHTAARTAFKVTIEGDEQPKGAR